MTSVVGTLLKGKVKTVTKFGAFIELENGEQGMVHISEISTGFVSEIRDYLTEGQDVTVKVINIDEKDRINLSIKKAEMEIISQKRKEPPSFEDMMSKFKQDSESKLADYKISKECRKTSNSKRSYK